MMTETQDTKLAYHINEDGALTTLHYLRGFTQEIGALAQRSAATDGDYANAKSYVNSEAARIVAPKVADLILTAAIKTGVTVDEKYLPFFTFIGYTQLYPSINGDYSMADGTKNTHLAGIATLNAQREIAGKIEDKGNRLYSLPVNDVAFRAGAITIRFLEALGSDIDHEQIIEVLNKNDLDLWCGTSQLTNNHSMTKATSAAYKDIVMKPIMEMLAAQSE